MKKEERKKNKKSNNERDHDRDDTSDQERLLVKDADFATLTVHIQSLSLLRSMDQMNKFLQYILPSIGSIPVIRNRSLDKFLFSALNPMYHYISHNPTNEDNLIRNSNYYYYPNFFGYLTPASNKKHTKHDNLQDSTGRRDDEVKTPLTQMQKDIESTYLSGTYFPQAVSPLIPHHYTPTAALENNTSLTRNGSIRLHTDLQANRIANSFGADAVTVGKDIFFARGKYDTTTPKGIALILHELEHVRQHQTNQDLKKGNSSNSNNIPASLSFSLEKKALETEKNVLMYFALYEDYIRRYQVPSSIMMSAANNYSEMPTNYFYPISRIGHAQSHLLNIAFHSALEIPYSDSIFREGNTPDFSYGMLMRNGLPNLKTWSLPLESVGAFPDLVSSHPIAHRNPAALIGHQNINTDVSMQNHNLIHKNSAITPFLADSGRSLAGPAPVHLSQLSQTSSSTNTNANTNMQPILTPGSSNRTDFTTDLDQLSDRVYQMIMEKIKIQREQRGFR